jgi:glycolate oxidase
MTDAMTEPKVADLETLAERFRSVLAPECVVTDSVARRPFETDAQTMHRQMPGIVVLPENTNQVAEVLKLCREFGVPVVPRGAGTGLSGGATPVPGGVLLALTKFTDILDIDYENRCVVAQPGVTNLGITKAVEDDGFYYAPDPSSQIACSIGGNVAQNSGGVHCLKYGLTVNNVLGVELVTMDGEILRIGGKHLDPAGYDLLSIVTGSEGLLGVITEVTVRILPAPETVRALLLSFDSIEAGGACVAGIIGAGIIPAGLEMMDRFTIDAVEEYCAPGYPKGAAAILICELDGPAAEVDHLVEQVSAIAERNGATGVRASTSDEERLRFWAGRKAAFPAAAKIKPDYYVLDGTIPRNQLAPVLTRIGELARESGLTIANVFHVGDGNLHPLILYDANVPGEMEAAEKLGHDILRLCVEVGGVLSGEHGIGTEKRALMTEMFTDIDMQQQQRLKCAFDPDQHLNPGKVFPTLHRCAELGAMHVHKGEVAFPDLPRF